MALHQKAEKLKKETPDVKKAAQDKAAGKIFFMPISGSIDNIDDILNNVLSSS
ncbi:TPA: hypothetical protein ACKPX5_000102 [Serratia marcescens]|uniref:hypothetical protein n=1 Tax=Serratia nevei TaxID=2703794 RepID=UPI0038C05F5C